MARYVVNVQTPLPPDQAFDYMADLTNFAEWDPGVERAKQVEGDEPAAGAAFDVTVQAVPQPLVLRYRLGPYDRPDRFVAKAESTLLTSLDTISVRPDGDGSIVTYDAELTLKGLFGLADPFLSVIFGRIGDRAATGLLSALNGRRVEEPAA